MIAVVDYGRGNLFSLSQALRHLGAEHDVTEDPAHVALATQIILPGVGAFSDAMDRLAKRNLVAVLREALRVTRVYTLIFSLKSQLRQGV